MARHLKQAIKIHFETTERGRYPVLNFIPVRIKYPLRQPGSDIIIKIWINNNGTGPARELRLDEIATDSCIQSESTETIIGTIEPGEARIFNLPVVVVSSETRASLILSLSWSRLGTIETEEFEFQVEAQNEDVDWETVELTDPYSLEAVTTGDELVGRKSELTRLLRRARSKNVGSAFVYGQKRVGKT